MTKSESSMVANKGYGVEPKKDCGECHGKGFFYRNGWARTCECKKKALPTL